MTQSDRGTRRAHLQRSKNRPKPMPLWMQRGFRLGVVATLLGVVIGGPWWLISSGWVGHKAHQVNEAWMAHTAKAGLRVDSNIFVTGRIETAPADVVMALDITKGQPLLKFNPDEAKERLENLPWVKAAMVERRFPNTVLVNITERTPLGFYQKDGQLSLVDGMGITLAKDGLERWAGLPVLVGDGAPLKVGELLSQLKHHPDIARRVKSVTLVSERRWNLQLEGNVTILLPENDQAHALQRLEEAQNDSRLLDKDVSAVDLRLADRMIVTPTAAASVRRLAPKGNL